MFGKKKKQDVIQKNADEANQVFLSVEHIKSIEEIFDRLDSKDAYQRTPLHRAVECGVDPLWIKRMLKQGADPNVQDDNGNTPLHYAAQNNDFQTVQLLLKYKANPKIINEYKRNALCDINAANHEHPLALYELLLKHGARGCFWERSQSLSEESHKALITLAIKYQDPGMPPDVDSQMNTLLHWATYYGLEEEIEILIKKKFDLNAKNIELKTALMIATEKGLYAIKGILERAVNQ